MTTRKRTPKEVDLLRQLEPDKAIIPDDPASDPVEIDVTNIPVITEPKESLKEKLLGKLKTQEPATKQKTSKKGTGKNAEKSYELFRNTIPMSLAAIASMQFRRICKPGYEAVAPTRDEMAEILLPIFNLISRYIEISGKISQNAEDIGAAIFASITLSLRMLMTAQEIRSYGQQITPTEQLRDNAEQTIVDTAIELNRRNHERRDARRNSPQESNGAFGNYYAQDEPGHNGIGINGTNGNGDAQPGNADDESWQRLQVADLLRKDTLGRRQMGLAPRILREGD